MNGSFLCAHCGKHGFKSVGHINRSAKCGAPLFCGRKCFGLQRRLNRSDAEKRALKAEYDAEYREINRAKLKARKAAYYQRTHDPVKEAEARKKRMPQHVEYCRRPEYRKWKQEYDRKHRAGKFYGPFSEAFLLLQDLEAEIASRASRYEIYSANGTRNKWIQRRRDYESLVGR